MQLDILTPEKKIFTGEVDVVRLPGVDGTFSLMHNHAPIISALAKGVISFALPASVQLEANEIEGKLIKDTSNNHSYKIGIKSGFVECLNNKIAVLVEGTTLDI